jgi:hypothetical protein
MASSRSGRPRSSRRTKVKGQLSVVQSENSAHRAALLAAEQVRQSAVAAAGSQSAIAAAEIAYARTAQLGISYETVDAIAGFTTRYTTKLLAEEPDRHMGVMAFDAMLHILAVKIVLIPDPEKLERVKKHWNFERWKNRLRGERYARIRRAPNYAVVLATNRLERRSRSEGLLVAETTRSISAASGHREE